VVVVVLFGGFLCLCVGWLVCIVFFVCVLVCFLGVFMVVFEAGFL